MLSDQSYIKNSEDFLKIQSTAESRYVMCYHFYDFLPFVQFKKQYFK